MPPHPLNNDKQSTRARSEAGKIKQDIHPQQRLRRQRVPNSTSDAGSTSSGVNASYNGAMPMGGM
eukprot:gene27769-31369_t